jgi:peptidyl-tRNA hydrolase
MAGEPSRVSELVLPFVVRIERRDPPERTDALEAAAKAVLHMLTCDQWPEQVAQRIAEWDAERIRKVVRRARGADWRRAELLEGITIRHRSAEVRVHPPIPVDGWPPELARLQVQGTNLDDPEPPPTPEPGVPTVLLSPLVEMSTGKSMAQAAHAAQLGWRAASVATRHRWAEAAFPLAVRDTTPGRWAAAVAGGAPVVRDAGFTEVQPGAMTALFLPPQVSDW